MPLCLFQPPLCRLMLPALVPSNLTSSLLLLPTLVQLQRLLFIQEEVLLVLLHSLLCSLMLLDMLLVSQE